MFRHSIICLFLFCVSKVVFPNPLPTDPFTMPAITEVAVVSPMEWYIEVNGDWYLPDSSLNAFPCSSTVFLRISATSGSTSIYRARVGFAKNQYGIISRNSLTGVLPGRTVSLTPTDTIMIAKDSVNLLPQAASSGKVWYWSFTLRPVATGNVLVNLGLETPDRQAIYETSRKSLGDTASLTTTHRITLLDQFGAPLPRISSSGVGNRESDTNGTFEVTTSIRYPDGLMNFYDGYDAHPMGTRIFPSHNVYFDDKKQLVKDTLRFHLMRYQVTMADTRGNPLSGLYFYQPIHLSVGISMNNYSRILPRSENPVATWFFRVYDSIPTDTFCIAQDFPDSGADCFALWSPTFIDTPKVINVTVNIDPTMIHRQQYVEKKAAGVTLTVLPVNRQTLNVVISSSLNTIMGTVELYTIAGRVAAASSFRLKSPGTSTIALKASGGNLPAGTYCCRLTTMDGSISQSHMVTLP